MINIHSGFKAKSTTPHVYIYIYIYSIAILVDVQQTKNR